MITYAGVEVQGHVFLNSTLDGGERSASFCRCFTPWEGVPGIDWIRCWMGLRSGVDAALKNKSLVVPGINLQLSRSQTCHYHDLGTPPGCRVSS
jgi:hypothetical protein